jgi:hypothetical protein
MIHFLVSSQIKMKGIMNKPDDAHTGLTDANPKKEFKPGT